MGPSIAGNRSRYNLCDIVTTFDVVHHMRRTSADTKMQALSRSEVHSSQNRVPFKRVVFIQDHLTNALPSDQPVSACC